MDNQSWSWQWAAETSRHYYVLQNEGGTMWKPLCLGGGRETSMSSSGAHFLLYVSVLWRQDRKWALTVLNKARILHQPLWLLWVYPSSRVCCADLVFLLWPENGAANTNKQTNKHTILLPESAAALDWLRKTEKKCALLTLFSLHFPEYINWCELQLQFHLSEAFFLFRGARWELQPPITFT